MEGGVAFFLLPILVLVAVGFAIALYLTGGALLAKSDRNAGDADEPRPIHSQPTSPTHRRVGRRLRRCDPHAALHASSPDA